MKKENIMARTNYSILTTLFIALIFAALAKASLGVNLNFNGNKYPASVTTITAGSSITMDDLLKNSPSLRELLSDWIRQQQRVGSDQAGQQSYKLLHFGARPTHLGISMPRDYRTYHDLAESFLSNQLIASNGNNKPRLGNGLVDDEQPTLDYYYGQENSKRSKVYKPCSVNAISCFGR